MIVLLRDRLAVDPCCTAVGRLRSRFLVVALAGSAAAIQLSLVEERVHREAKELEVLRFHVVQAPSGFHQRDPLLLCRLAVAAAGCLALKRVQHLSAHALDVADPEVVTFLCFLCWIVGKMSCNAEKKKIRKVGILHFCIFVRSTGVGCCIFAFL